MEGSLGGGGLDGGRGVVEHGEEVAHEALEGLEVRTAPPPAWAKTARAARSGAARPPARAASTTSFQPGKPSSRAKVACASRRLAWAGTKRSARRPAYLGCERSTGSTASASPATTARLSSLARFLNWPRPSGPGTSVTGSPPHEPVPAGTGRVGDDASATILRPGGHGPCCGREAPWRALPTTVPAPGAPSGSARRGA